MAGLVALGIEMIGNGIFAARKEVAKETILAAGFDVPALTARATLLGGLLLLTRP